MGVLKAGHIFLGLDPADPPLRVRQGDIVPLVEHFLRIANREFRRSWSGVSAEAARVLCGYP